MNRICQLIHLTVVILAGLTVTMSASGDTIEFMNGATIQGTITEIDSAKKVVKVSIKVGSRILPRTYASHTIHAITQKGARQIITPKPGTAPASAPSTTNPGLTLATQSGRATNTRTRAEIDAIINSQGADEPAWLASTRLNYPQTLDLTWPTPPPDKGWNANKNVGQFVWSTINENEGRWREGVKFMYFLIDRYRGDSIKTAQATKALASMYFRYFQDYARAAYWWRKTASGNGQHDQIHLAECYFRLGNKDMAMTGMQGVGVGPGVVKLLGAMGETDRAVKATDAYATASSQPHQAWLAAGDALSLAGDYKRAITYYDKVLTDSRKPRNKDYERRFTARARESIEAIQLFELLDVTKVKDGVYKASATGYEAAIDVEAIVKVGRIIGVRVVRHREKQYYSALRDVPEQILAKQSVRDIDGTSGATITARAIVNATARALKKGQQ